MKDKVIKVLQHSKNTYRTLPDKKQYIEFFTTLLSVPVLLTVILLNVNNLRNTTKLAAVATPMPTPVKEVIYVNPQNANTAVLASANKKIETPIIATSTPAPACDSSIGPIEIKNPKEGETISDNPVAVLINYEKGAHCAVVWAYRINGGRWSDYDDKSIALYNLPSGPVVFELKVKSIVSGEETILKRSVTYVGKNDAPETASNSAN